MKYFRLFLAFVLVLVISGCSSQESQPEIEAELTIVFENERYVLDIEEILAFDKVDFQANVKSSGNEPVLTDFGGVLLNDVLQSLDIQLDNQTITFKAEDGYQTMVTAQEVLQEDNVYIVYERDFKRTLSKDDGGSGPLEIVIAQDPFSQRWNKYLIEIIIEE